MRSLHRFIFLVKNLRGVLAALPDENLEPVASWLSRRFRYRDLGLPPSLYRAAQRVFEGRLGGKPFHILAYPTARVEKAATEAIRALSGTLPETVAEALLLASSYAAPLIATPGAAKHLQSIAVHIVRGPRLDAQQARLHLRIVDYTVLDAYVESIEELISLIERGASPEEVLEARRRRAEKDAKRYWRISGKGDIPTIIYPEHTHILLEQGLGGLLAGEEERILGAQLAAFNLEAVETA